MKVLVILGFILLLPIMLETSADACQYVESDNAIQEDFEEYDFIFSAKILTVGEYASYTPVILKVIEQWKGDTHDKAYLFTCKGKDFGGLQLQEGKSYLIFAEKLSSDSPIITDFGPTKLLSEAQDDILFLDQKSYITRFHYDESNVVKQAPLKQIQLGISFNEIQCKQNLVLIQKYDGTPACVTEPTKLKLIERGWTGNKITKPVSNNYNPYETRCGSSVIPYIPKNWHETEKQPSGEQWENLGRHLIKEEFYKQLKQQNIIFEPACFGIYKGSVEWSYPPRISMCTIVSELDGDKIYLEGTVHEFDVIDFEMTRTIPYPCDELSAGCFCNIEYEN